MTNLIVLDNRDSFVYNLVEALEKLTARPKHDKKSGLTEVYRNNVPADVIVDRARSLQALICLSPGPGKPEDAGNMMQVIKLAQDQQIPLLGVCLGFQALLQNSGAEVVRVGPVHGKASLMELTLSGAKVFGWPAGSTVPVARYHSLGCRTLVSGWQEWGRISEVVMAAGNQKLKSVGVQFHPESVLTQNGGRILSGLLDYLTEKTS